MERKVFAYVLTKEQCLKNTKNNQYVPDLQILLNKRSITKIAYVDCLIEKFALTPSNSIFINKFEYTTKKATDRSLIELKTFLNYLVEADNF